MWPAGYILANLIGYINFTWFVAEQHLIASQMYLHNLDVLPDRDDAWLFFIYLFIFFFVIFCKLFSQAISANSKTHFILVQTYVHKSCQERHLQASFSRNIGIFDQIQNIKGTY